MWNICRSQCSTPRLFRPERVENSFSTRKRSSLFSSSWFAASLPSATIRTAPNSTIRNNILDTSNLFSIDSVAIPHPSDRKFDSSHKASIDHSSKGVIYQQPGHLKDELSDKHQHNSNSNIISSPTTILAPTPLSASMITLKNCDQNQQSPIKMSTQDFPPSSSATHKSNESEYQRSFIWNGSQTSVVREHPPHDHNIMNTSVDSVLNSSISTNALNKAPVQIGGGSGVLFSMERSIDLKTSPEPERISEYHSKFKPFSDYVYVADEHRFRAQTPATKLASATADTTPSAKSWFTEVEERIQEACKYRARSQNGSTPIDPEWKGTRSKHRDFLALALATQITIAEKKSQKASRSSSAKPTSRTSRKELSSAPASLIDAPTPVSKVRPVKARTGTPTSKPSSTSTTDRNNNTVKQPEAKVWIKPKKKDSDSVGKKETDNSSNKNEPKAVPRAVKKAPEPAPIMDSEVKSVPLHTTQIKSPEELTGVKSPPPEAWKISIEKGNLQWVNNESPVNFDNKQNTDSTGILKPVAINGSKN